MNECMHKCMNTTKSLSPPKYCLTLVGAFYLFLTMLVSSVYWWFAASRLEKQQIQPFSWSPAHLAGGLGKRAKRIFIPATLHSLFITFSVLAWKYRGLTFDPSFQPPLPSSLSSLPGMSILKKAWWYAAQLREGSLCSEYHTPRRAYASVLQVMSHQIC